MMELKRLTTDNPEKNIEVLLNYAYAEDGWVKLRAAGGEEEVDLCDYIEQQRRELGFDCGVFSTDIRDGACMGCDCVLNLLNIVAIQAAELRGKLKHYEDMEEQERLVVLPCKVGDRIYRIYDDCTLPGDCGTKRMCKGCEYRNLFIEEQRFVISMLNGFGKLAPNYYLTREEAEQALKGGAET